MCKISIIVPVYNVEKYLSRCIESILGQTFEDFELILVNDGSTDNSSNICDYYAKRDSRIIVINKENEGAAIARNIALDICKGEYISFIDSDDLINKKMYEILFNNIIKYNADIAMCKHKRFKDDSEIESNIFENDIKILNNIEALENYFLDYKNKERIMYTVIWDKLYKRELFNEIRFPKVSFAEDGYVVYKLLYYSKKIIFIDNILYYYFTREGSLSRTIFSEKYLDIFRDRKEIFEFMYRNNKNLARLSVKSYIDKHIFTYKQIINSNLDINCEYYKKSIKNDIKSDIKKFKELNVDRVLINKSRIFIFNHKLAELYEEVMGLINKITIRLLG